MTDPVGDIIQVCIAATAVGASIVALVISYLDRRTQREIAKADRVESLRHAQLLFEQTQLLRLLENNRRGGSSDKLESARLGAEAAGIVGMLGPDRLPLSWVFDVDDDPDFDLKAFVADDKSPLWQRKTAEVQLALNKVTAEIREYLNKN